MNEKISTKLWVIKFCIKVIYPKYNLYTFLVFLAIKYKIYMKKLLSERAMDEFVMKTAPPHVIRLILKDHLEDNVPVVQHKCIIISREQYIQLCAENLFYLDHGAVWLALKLTPSIKGNHKQMTNISKENKLLKYGLGFMTSEIHKKLWMENETSSLEYVRIVPVVGSKLVQDNIALTTENEYYNIVSSYGLDNCKDIKVSFHPVPSLENAPKIAAVAEVSVIINDYDLSNDFVKEVLSNYFEEPKLVNINDVFSIDLTPVITAKYYYKYLDLVESTGKLYFKCIKIASDVENAMNLSISHQKIVQPYFIVRGVTQLTLGENIHMLKPKDEYFKVQEDGQKNLSFLQLCPAGLKQKFDQIQETIGPFLTGEMSMLFLLTTNQYNDILLWFDLFIN